jgi:hypothetical protein
MEKLKNREKSSGPENPADSFIFKIGLADVIRLTMFGTLISVSRFVFQMPIGVPGHTSVYWMGLLMLGKGLIPRFGAGTIMGIVSGILAIVFGLGKEGPLMAFKLIDGKVTLVEIAPGMDVEKDIIAHMGFRPEISPDLKEMPREIFQPKWGKLKEILAAMS